ncbi:MAG: hypothetical protein ACKO9D_06165, partial [Gammaproteobacteria bacterium]
MRNPLILAAVSLFLSACASVGGPSTASRDLEPARPAPPGPPKEVTDTLRAPTSYPVTTGQPPARQTQPAAAIGGNPYNDLMDRIRAGFQIEHDERSAIDNQALFFQRNPAYLDRVFGRAALYMH